MLTLTGREISKPSKLAKLNVNIDSMLCDLNSAFNPLHRDCLMNYQVTAINTAQVCMSVVMPKEMLLSFSTLLESMGGFFRVVNGKARSSAAVLKAHDLDELSERKSRREAFHVETCSIYDNLINQGHSESESVKLTNIALKARNNPWATYDIVKNVLRSTGRFRKLKGRKEEIKL